MREAVNYKPDTHGVTTVNHDDNITVRFHRNSGGGAATPSPPLVHRAADLSVADAEEAIHIALWERLVAKGTFAR